MSTLLDQNKALGRIEATTKATDAKLDAAISKTTTLETRVGKLEGSHNFVKGATAVWGLIASGVATALGWYFGSNK